MNFLPAECFRIAIGTQGYEYPSGVWRRSLISLPHPILGAFWALYAQACILTGKHNTLLDISERHSILLYYKAYSLYICGKFIEALDYAERFCSIAPKHREGNYLLSDILFELGKKDEAFQLLRESFLSKRKTWVKLANLVESPQDYALLKLIYKSALSEGKIAADDPVILENYAMGAQRAGEYEDAVRLWKYIVTLPTPPVKTIKRKLATGPALTALRVLSEKMEEAGFSIFLISGTLLGFIRNGDFLTHDTDLDVGIFDGFDPLALRRVIWATGCFTIMPQRSPHCIRVRHVNGTPIDIFTHYRTTDDYWHGGVKVSWHNTPFGLKPADFNGISIWIPDDPERYLEENYGIDWRKPKRSFDSAKDCPNSVLENEFELYIHKLKNSI